MLQPFLRTTLLFLLFHFGLLAQTTVTFKLGTPPPGEPAIIGLRGNTFPLSWDKTYPVKQGEDGYFTTVTFGPSEELLEFKFVSHAVTDGEVVWEGVENRVIALNEPEVVFSADWNEPVYIDPNAQPLIEVAALQKDYELIETVFRKVHPGTYRYLTEAELNERLEQLKRAYSKPLTIAEAYLALNAFTAAVRCDHTASPLYNQGAVVNSMLHYGKDKFPFTFRWRQGRMVVVQDATAEQVLPPGTEVVSINGLAVGEVLEQLRNYVGADGPAIGPIDGALSLRGYSWRLEAFDALYPLVYPIPAGGLKLEVKESSVAASREVTVAPLRRKDRAELLARRYPDFPTKADDLWNLEILDDKTAILTVGDFTGFGLGALSLDFKAFFANAFAEIDVAGVEKLILDVRENRGGNDPIVLELFSYFKSQPLSRPAFEGRMRYQEFPESLRPYVKTWGDNVPAFFAPKKGEPDASGRYFVYPKAFRPRKVKNRANAFAGEVVLLTGRINTSLGFYLANNFRRYEMGVIIGETTGGSLRGISGGNLAMLRLPGTNLELDFPVLGGFATKEQPAHGVVPDIEVEVLAEDQLKGRDRTMETALAFLAKE